MHPTNARLKVEPLGTRILPSANPLVDSLATSDGPVHVAHLDVRTIRTPTDTIDGLDGTIHGTFKRFAGVPADIGLRFALDGSGKLGGLDTFAVKGVLHGTGFVAQGRATGLLTLTNRHGSITVKLQGPEQPGFAALPGDFHFTVAAGTGAYKNLRDAGDVKLTVQTHGAATAFRLVFA
jgi:hypothetical protein